MRMTALNLSMCVNLSKWFKTIKSTNKQLKQKVATSDVFLKILILPKSACGTGSF